VQLNIVLAWIGGIASTAGIWILRARLDLWKDEQRAQMALHKEESRKVAETDRATYGERLTILVRDNLAAYIRSARWKRDDEDLRRLLTNLENGGASGFVDERVDTLWVWLVEVSVDCARRRLAGTITTNDIQTYNVIRSRWMAVAKLSFGPLPEVFLLRQNGDAEVSSAA
jgi:hypothetical protein